MKNKTNNLNQFSNKYAWIINTDARHNTAIAIVATFLGVQLAGIGIDAAQATMTPQDSFKTGWKQARSEKACTWLYICTFVTLVLLGVYALESCSSSHEAKCFTEKIIKHYAHKNNIDIANFKTKDFHNIADFILSYMPEDKISQLLERCTKIREEIYHYELQALKKEITFQEYNKFLKIRIIELMNYVTPIMTQTMENNPALQKLMLDMATRKTKYAPSKTFIHQK